MPKTNESLLTYVSDKIINDILCGKICPGDILFSKRQIATMYSVSRTVIDRVFSYLLEKGYIIKDGIHYAVAKFNKYSNFESLINFSKYENQSFTKKEILDIIDLKHALDILAIKLMPLPFDDKTYLFFKNNITYIKKDCSECHNKKCTVCADILYNFYL